MAHSFLIEPGLWNVTGNWLKPNSAPILLQGGIQITWKANWFKMTTSLTCDDEAQTKIVYQCRGNLDHEAKHYTYVSQHSILGNIEGEGRLGERAIVQYYWFRGIAHNQKGLDTFCYLNDNAYHLSSSILSGHSILHTIEATLQR